MREILYQAVGLQFVSVGRGWYFVHSDVTKKNRILEEWLVRLLSCCDTFRTLEHHAIEIIARTDRMRALQDEIGSSSGKLSIKQEVIRQLELLSEYGLLVSSDIFLGKRVPEDEHGCVGRISTFCVISRDRPQSLRRCLESQISNCQEYGRDPDFLVVDDSEDSKRKEIESILRKLSREYGVRVALSTRTDKISFGKHLIQLGIPRETIRFGLLGRPGFANCTGANRNTFLLETLDTLALSSDDDMMCRVARIPSFRPGTCVASAAGTTENIFLSEPQEADSAVWESVDTLSIHEDLLGKKVNSFAGTLDLKSSFGITQTLGQRVASGTGTIRATVGGSLGDSGWGSPQHYLFVRRQDLEHLLKSEEVFHRYVQSRMVFRAFTQRTITDATFFMGGWMGIDNRSLVPPFMPIGRGQDHLFGSVLWQTVPDTLIGGLPWAIAHWPLEERQFNAGSVWRDAGRLSLNTVLTNIISSVALPSQGIQDPIYRIKQIGMNLEGIASSSPSAFRKLALFFRARFVSRRVAYLEDLISDRGKFPEWWIECVERSIKVARASVRADAEPDDLPRIPEGRMALFQQLVGDYARLLICWPDILQATKEAKNMGHSLVRTM